MSEQEFKSVAISCKRCAKEFELRLPIHFYEQMVATHEAIFGPQVVFAGACPDCRKDDPLPRTMDEAGVPTAGRDFIRKLSNK